VNNAEPGPGTFICGRTGITSDSLGLKYTGQARLPAQRADAGDISSLERIIASFDGSEADTGASQETVDSKSP
jgi:hypothetical protein